MQKNLKLKRQYWLPLIVVGIFFSFSSFYPNSKSDSDILTAYRAEGLSDIEAAKHILERFTYGSSAAQIDAVVKMGIDKWYSQQLAANYPDDSLHKRLSNYDAINLTNTEVCKKFPPAFVVLSLALKDSVVSKDSVDKAVNKAAFNQQILSYMDKKGLKSDQYLYKQFINQNILRAVYSNNQLQEVLTDFWFNHFNVSFLKGECAQFIPAYERDVIRPNALGKFSQLVISTAKSPAMLYYLDNFISEGASPVMSNKINDEKSIKDIGTSSNMKNNNVAINSSDVKMNSQAAKNLKGLNENYARELMELHTMGVNGGYTQHDVTEAARILTGWTVYPISDFAYGSEMKALVKKVGPNNLVENGFIHEGDFLFTPTRHDQGEKVVLNHKFPANGNKSGGFNEGLYLLQMLSNNPSTARFICRKLAIRFVCEDPPKSLLDKMSKSFLQNQGDIKEVLTTMIESREFWVKKNILSKIKSPFEFITSSLRSTNSEVLEPSEIFIWLSKMGEKIYYYQAPTGFPDNRQYWISTGSLITRMNFALALTGGQISGVKVNLDKIIKVNEPAVNKDVIKCFSNLFLPGSDNKNLESALSAMVGDTKLTNNMTAPSASSTAINKSEKPTSGALGDMMMNIVDENKGQMPRQSTDTIIPKNENKIVTKVQSMIAGIILGSPDFQRR